MVCERTSAAVVMKPGGASVSGKRHAQALLSSAKADMNGVNWFSLPDVVASW